MIKKLVLPLLLLSGSVAFAQNNNGLIAHWDMNGTLNDVTGMGHNGTGVNVIPATGINGQPNTAYYFSGSSSYVYVPYSPDLNITQYSICAKVKVEHFYDGPCQGNVIFSRGRPTDPGNYTLWFDDNAYDNGDCNARDTTKDVFIATAGSNQPPSHTDWQYAPTIDANTWYSVVVTYDSSVFRVYVDSILMSTVSGYNLPIGFSNDSIIIGMDIWDSLIAPYNFTGWIDDIRLYDRPLSDTEVAAYCRNTVPTGTPVLAGSDSKLTVYPNPATDKINVILPWQNDKTTLQVINETGAVVLTKDVATSQASLDITNFPSGVYFIKANCRGTVLSNKILKL
jgi:hypothetical protein